MGESINYSYFLTEWAGIYTRNLEDRLPQLNGFDFVVKAFPEYAPALIQAAKEMLESGYDPRRVDAFITLYKEPCALCRVMHLWREMEVITVYMQHKKRIAEDRAIREAEEQKKFPGYRQHWRRKGKTPASTKRSVQEINRFLLPAD